MTKFFRPDSEFIRWIVGYANGRLIIDLGCGDNHLKSQIVAAGGSFIGIDLLNENADIVIDVTKTTWLDFDPNLILFLLARPCHGSWLEDIFSRVKAEILYIGLERNLEIDLDGIDYKRLPHMGGSVDGEYVWVINEIKRNEMERLYVTATCDSNPGLLYFGHIANGMFYHGDGPGRMPLDGVEVIKEHLYPDGTSMSYSDADINHHVLCKVEPDDPVVEWRFYDPVKGGDRVYCVNGFLSPEGEWYLSHGARHAELAYSLWLQTYKCKVGTDLFKDFGEKGWILFFNGRIHYHPQSRPTKEQNAALRSIASNCPDSAYKRDILNATRGKYVEHGFYHA